MNIHVIDSHTGGEPTRVVVSGVPDLGRGPLSGRREIFRARMSEGSEASFGGVVPNEAFGACFVVGIDGGFEIPRQHLRRGLFRRNRGGGAATATWPQTKQQQKCKAEDRHAMEEFPRGHAAF